jgi:carbon-monoxide dehydrogenase large subunit
MSNKYIGKAVKRVEDKRFITGKGKYTDDMILPGQTYAYIIRSPYAHAKVKSIDISQALASEGVVAVFTGDDIAQSGINGVPAGWQVNFKNGDIMKEPPHPYWLVQEAL